MMINTPPQPPAPVSLGDDDGLRRVRATLHLWALTALTVLLTAWVMTFGLVWAILALVTAKHVLVAILVMGLGVDSRDGEILKESPHAPS